MADKPSSNPADYITSLTLDGLKGRMLYVPSPKNKTREIILIYGHHSSLERWWGLVQNLNEYGSVIMPDLPGFGGMDSFYKVGKKPTVDNYADYLAAFIKQRFENKKITLVGISFGFAVITRMLQLYPELTSQVELLVSLIGFMHKDDFLYSRPERLLCTFVTRFLATQPMSFMIRYLIFNRFVLKRFYMQLLNAKRRMIEVTKEGMAAAVDFDFKLWQINDVRTHWQTLSEFLRLDNCSARVDLPIIHVTSKLDHYFNNQSVEEHMQSVFSGYTGLKTSTLAHAPSIISTKKEAGVLLPAELRQMLR